MFEDAKCWLTCTQETWHGAMAWELEVEVARQRNTALQTAYADQGCFNVTSSDMYTDSWARIISAQLLLFMSASNRRCAHASAELRGETLASDKGNSISINNPAVEKVSSAE